MRTSRPVLFAAALLFSLTATAQGSSASRTAPPGTVSLADLIATVARDSGKRFVLDPRVLAMVTLVGEKPSRISYDELLTILDAYGFAAVQTAGYVLVMPDAAIRYQPLPFVADGKHAPDGEYVTAVLHVRSLPAAWLVPILRPLVSRSGDLSAMPCADALLIVERAANVRRLESVVKALDTGVPIKPPSCAMPQPAQ
jgi:general secretion pathway protein D